MRPVSSAFAATGGLLLVLATGAFAQGFTNAVGGGFQPKPPPPPSAPAPAPAKPGQPAATSPAATPAAASTPAANAPALTAPAAPAAANPQLAQRLAVLRAQLAERKSDTPESIQPLASLDEVRQRVRQYRARVDRVERSPFTSGVPLPEELVREAKDTTAKWSGLADAIRAGRPPATLAAATLRRLSQPAGLDDPAPVTGNIWSGLSNDYFADITRVESLADKRATPFRESPTMREFARLMDEAEARLKEIEAGPNPESEANLRDLSWRLHRIWRLGAQLQVHQLEQQLKASPDEQALWQTLQASDSARALHHRGLGAAPSGSSAPPVLVPAQPGLTIRAQLDDAESTMDVKPTVPSRLAELAAELYHVHYLLANTEEFEREGDAASHDQSVAERRRDYEGRRLAVLGEIVQETERLRAGR